MANALTTGSSITCSFQGSAKVSSSAKLQVGGEAVLLASDVTSWTMSGCNQMTGNTKTPCAKLGAVSAGKATKLQVGSAAVLLDSFQAMTAAPPAAHSASAKNGRSKLQAS
jgi:hypothetical protein